MPPEFYANARPRGRWRRSKARTPGSIIRTRTASPSSATPRRRAIRPGARACRSRCATCGRSAMRCSPTSDWDTAGHAYAAEHDRHYGIIHRVDGWVTPTCSWSVGPKASASCARALSLAARHPCRFPDPPMSGSGSRRATIPSDGDSSARSSPDHDASDPLRHPDRPAERRVARTCSTCGRRPTAGATTRCGTSTTSTRSSSIPRGRASRAGRRSAALAQATKRARIGTLVNGNTYRNPCLTAKMAATLDHVSGGRLNLGIGAGWFELEHRAFGIDFKTVPERLAALDEALPDHQGHVHAGADDAARQALHASPTRSACRSRCRSRIRRS